jgi:hypothetical protein
MPIISGQILESSWGYDQTNYDFYYVLSVKNGWATLQKMTNVSQPINGFREMTTLEVPGEIDNSEQPFRRKIKNCGWVSINSYAGARPWNLQPKTASHYA